VLRLGLFVSGSNEVTVWEEGRTADVQLVGALGLNNESVRQKEL
jgi:hypothetical protein